MTALLLFGRGTTARAPLPPDRPQSRVATYRPYADWGSGTVVDTGPYNDLSGWYLNQPGLVVDGIGRDQLRAYAPPAAPTFDLTLDNWTGRFSPGGPIGGFVGRGATMWLDMAWGAEVLANDPEVGADSAAMLANGEIVHRLFEGISDTAEQALTRPGRTVAVRGLGYLITRLQDRRPNTGRPAGPGGWPPATAGLYKDIRTDEAIAILLDLCEWPRDKRDLDRGDTTLTYWWLDGQSDALTALNAIVGAEGAGGCAYEQGGVFHFEGRQTRQNRQRSTTPQWIFTDQISGGFLRTPGANDPAYLANDTGVLANGASPLGRFAVNPSELESNPDEVVRSVAARINVRSPVPAQVVGTERGKIWELGGPLVLSAGQEVVTEAHLSDPYELAVTPVADGVGPGPYDYRIETGALVDGTPELLQDSGAHVRIRWKAGGSLTTVQGVSSNGPQLRAVSLPVASQTVVRSTVDTSAMAPRYASREALHEMWAEVPYAYTLQTVNSMAQRYQAERRQATIRVANLDAAHMRVILDARVSDQVIWQQSHGGINDPYWVERISHEISPGGGLHVMTLGLERVFSRIQTRFDDAVFEPFDGSNQFGE